MGVSFYFILQVGDPLDLKMFESTKWVLDEPGLDDTNKYDMMMPSVVRPSAPDVVISNENVETEVSYKCGFITKMNLTKWSSSHNDMKTDICVSYVYSHHWK